MQNCWIFVAGLLARQRRGSADGLGVSQSGELSKIVGYHAQTHVNFPMLKSLLQHRIRGKAIEDSDASLSLGSTFLVAAEFRIIQSLGRGWDASRAGPVEDAFRVQQFPNSRAVEAAVGSK